MSDAAKAKWLTPFSKGSMKSNTNEDWAYDHGVLKCTFGPNREAGAWTWDGSDLKNESVGSAFLDGDAMHFVFAGEKKAFWSLSFVQTGDKISWTCTQIVHGWRSKVNWTHDLATHSLTVDEKTGTDHPEGSPVSWTVLGSFPPPVAIVAAMMVRSQKLNEAYTEWINRSFKRCGILTMSPIEAWVCAQCAESASRCACCKTTGTHAGTLCKQCAVKGRMRCVRCNEPIGATRVAAVLCDTHGLGSRAKECCKMHHKELR